MSDFMGRGELNMKRAAHQIITFNWKKCVEADIGTEA